MISEFYNVIFFFILCLIISSILIFFTFLIKDNKSINFEKISPYECGFEEFNDSCSTFDNQFFIIGIVFIIFDFETIFLIPWSINLNFIDLFGCFSILIFSIPLVIGFVYEFKRGAFDWVL